MKGYEFIIVDRKEPVLIVTINRPEKLNTFLTQSWDEITDVCDKLRHDHSIRYVIFTGAGNNFSAGDDAKTILKGQTEMSHEEQRYAQQVNIELGAKLTNIEQITIAAIRGVCLGSGLGLVIACDFRIATPSARLGIPETRVGVIFSWGFTHRLNRLVGPAVTKEMILTARMLDAEEAMSVGLVNHVVPEEKLMDKAYELIDLMEGNAPNALRLAKRMINASTIPQTGDLFIMEPEIFQYQFMSGEPAEGANAFLEKRKPKWH